MKAKENEQEKITREKSGIIKEAIKTREQKGITLVALIVTIIIMLILAGVTINVALGDNGLFSKSKEAVEIHKEEAAREKVSMAIGEYMLDINKREMTEEEKYNRLIEILEKIGPTSVASDENYYETEVDGHIFWVNKETQEIILKGKTNEKPEPEPEPEKEIESIALNQTTLTIAVGKTTEQGIQVTYTPSDATNQEVIWSTSDASKATVDSNGKVTGVAETGENETVTITATTANGKTATCKVTIGGVEKHININGTSAVVNTKNIYGAIVTGYTCARSDVSWQLFYIDEENKDNATDISKVYLIASEFVAPPVKNKTPKLLLGGDTICPKAYRFATKYGDKSILEGFIGKVPDTTFTTKYLSDWKGSSAESQENLQATNYMLDQTMWSEYKGNEATEAYGGPTLPLFAASYNDICKASTKLGYITPTKGTGYQINIGGGVFGDYLEGLEDISAKKLLYFIGKGPEDAYGMFLASPFTPNPYSMAYASSGRIFGTTIYNTMNGFRPVVSLNSNVQFTVNEDGTYAIKP